MLILAGFRERYLWLDNGSNPHEIGGCATDVTLIADRLISLIEDAYPATGVPAEVVERLAATRTACEAAETAIKMMIEFVSDDLAVQEGKR
ncbi:hypothetical protein LCGC14_1043980 [marine sediment metagenome]|uniref:Uncharacterized protein n=2 Tax=root TaxID=1 RepID=A0A9C9NDL2_9HYPH|nr:hypothetical protein [Aurantimonas coralicida]